MSLNLSHYIKKSCYNQAMYLAIDIGATKTLIALFSKRGRIRKRIKFKTSKNQKIFLDSLVDALKSFQRFNINLTVVAVPGLVQKNYTVKFGNRNWPDTDLFTPIKNLLGCPVFLENDASLAALYEGYRLSGRTVFLTFSTGIGGGIVEKNRLLPESATFEPGHKKYSYNGKVKEWEDIASASAIESAHHVDYATSLRKKSELTDIANRVYLGLPDIIKKYHPDTIILGGPLGRIFKLYTKYLPALPDTKLRRPKRPSESPIYGCYLFAKQKERE